MRGPEARGEGHGVLRQRIESALGRPVDAGTLAGLMAGLSPGELRMALRGWLPELETELRRRGSDTPRAPVQLPEIDPRAGDWVLAGGWYTEAADFTLRLRPCGHGDPFMKAWLELAAEADGAGADGPQGDLLRELSDPDAPGRCAKCHDMGMGQASGMQWMPPDTPRASLVHFSHAPHVTLLDERGCGTCHTLATSPQAVSALEPGSGSGEFDPLEPAQCASCHAPELDTGGCLTCHDYHAERSRAARLDDLPPLRASLATE